MSNHVPNTIGLRAEMEKQGFALDSSGSYVLSSLEVNELDLLQKTDFSKLQFGGEDHVVVARGPKGSLVRFARVTSDCKYGKFLGKFVSIRLINGEVFTKTDFIRSIAQNPTLRVVHVSSATDYVGVLHGDRTKKYKSLIYRTSNGFLSLDLEENPPAQSMSMKIRIVSENPPEGLAAKIDLLSLAEIAKKL